MSELKVWRDSGLYSRATIYIEDGEEPVIQVAVWRICETGHWFVDEEKSFNLPLFSRERYTALLMALDAVEAKFGKPGEHNE